jgi:hypothetical protein
MKRILLLVSICLLPLAIVLRAQPTAYLISATITNPTPQAGDFFGRPVAAFGADRVLIGAQFNNAGIGSTGSAYVYSTNGTLLTTITNPLASVDDKFGFAVAAVGLDRLVVGAVEADAGPPQARLDDVGAAYLFSANGTLLNTFTNPFPGEFDHFGCAVAVVGGNKILIGASDDQIGGIYTGAAYLFSTNGALLTTLTNPTPEFGDFFGRTMVAVGDDKFLIGAYYDNAGGLGAGAAHLFSTNGTLLVSFTNPTPAIDDLFGAALAAVGADRVLIGAYGDKTGAANSGAAYLFSTGGALLATITNPHPALNDNFGWALSAVGTDKLLIGAPNDDTGAANSGSAYLFSTNGALLAAIPNPTPAPNDSFGASLAAVRADRVIIGAYLDDIGAADSGAAHLFNLLPIPSLSIARTSTNTIVLSWPSSAAGFVLQENPNSVGPAGWSNVLTTPADNGTSKSVILNPTTGNRYFRVALP